MMVMLLPPGSILLAAAQPASATHESLGSMLAHTELSALKVCSRPAMNMAQRVSISDKATATAMVNVLTSSPRSTGCSPSSPVGMCVSVMMTRDNSSSKYPASSKVNGWSIFCAVCCPLAGEFTSPSLPAELARRER
eukprot:2597607-Prymnesium_polylepis.1